ncbi:3-keto-L-gulonate-6-phosphate decarboxylase ulaD [Vibrio nigripulchritudo SO65]|uniref:3-dehydro-L-gulonate-6-phosphate decarboxylase n=1 Tax=Vibrio nigripulchritudo TaxID=28173 RepID=UPI0003B18807|nr:3-dehydro-L-gulonate-6-phosphate decarboxylase [Vibrio nigripulchritudo]CCN34597.1 3-keto-L-gulonate-6-phosphate decarboxylase ulaD [Vibrio nigripulchritudo AM115]CCN40592.1 3-keto-L-gulonate-6-phosphate decarboxylase ulaD [Vibrio nigripulchritudo FTn2]CCN66114.1 3-keto-L-gulonate-6-phosphate decarboxylase ulaD [Vibrio nigripulchritudo POn4]CCN78604.1 3-keto-L-gulonate-6-phosphate decarboxylase ulaD [Vibrio nigripulchritudo SO65]
MIPKLQVALDVTTEAEALDAARTLAPVVDVLEAGTLICFSEGMSVVRSLRAQHPEKPLVVDMKLADAGKDLGEMAFKAGGSLLTVICAAPLATMESALNVARAHNGDIQIELFGDWTFEQAQEWRKLGISQAIYHRGRDAQAAGQTWHQEDLDWLQRMCDLGFKMSVTGGITPDLLPTFRHLPIDTFIAGRALLTAPDPRKAAMDFKETLSSLWRE